MRVCKPQSLIFSRRFNDSDVFSSPTPSPTVTEPNLTPATPTTTRTTKTTAASVTSQNNSQTPEVKEQVKAGGEAGLNIDRLIAESAGFSDNEKQFLHQMKLMQVVF